jgi:hypothetical protein
MTSLLFFGQSLNSQNAEAERAGLISPALDTFLMTGYSFFMPSSRVTLIKENIPRETPVCRQAGGFSRNK